MTANEIRKRLKGILEQYPAEHHKELGKLIFDLRDEIIASKAVVSTPVSETELLIQRQEELIQRQREEIATLNSKLQAAQSFVCKATEAEKALAKANQVLIHSVPTIVDLKKFNRELCDLIFDTIGHNNDLLLNDLRINLVSIFQLFGEKKYVQRIEKATRAEIISLLHIGFSELQFLRTFTGHQFSRIPIHVVSKKEEGVI